MECRDAIMDLVSYHKDEMPAEDRAVVEEHLAECEACRGELENIEQTFNVLHQDLVPIELSAHFRLAMADRLDEATHVAAQAKVAGLHAVRPSERHLEEMDRPFVARLWQHARRSPYFAASLLLHAAAALIVLGLFIQLRRVQSSRDERPPRRLHVERGSDDVREGPDLRQVVGRRRSVFSYQTKPEFTATGITVSVQQSMKEDGNVVLVADETLSCVMAFLTDREDRKSLPSQGVLKEYPGSMQASIQNARLKVPSSIVGDLFDSTDRLVVFDLDDRLEFWSVNRWNALQQEVDSAITRLPAGLPHLIAAILPRRREES